MSLLVNILKFVTLYLVQAGFLWGSLELSTYLQGDGFKKMLDGYWILFYAFPLLTTCLVFKEVQQASLPTDLGLTEEPCLAAYTEGRKAWRQNQLSFFLQSRGVLYIFIFSILLLLILYTVITHDLSFSAQNIIFSIAAAFFFGTNLLRMYLRNRTLRWLDIQHTLHHLSHHIRDEHSRLLKKFSSKQKASPEKCLSHISSTLELCKEYLKKITHDKTIELAVRSAFPHPEEQGNVVYKTLAMTEGLHNNEWTSEPIAANQGIPKCLIEDHVPGNILIYNNIKKAIRKKVFKEAKSEKDFPGKISSLMVGPLNAWDGNKKSLIGIVYVTSRNKKAFREEHIDCMRFIADTLSDTVSFSIITNHMLIVKGKKNAYLRQLLEKY